MTTEPVPIENGKSDPQPGSVPTHGDEHVHTLQAPPAISKGPGRWLWPVVALGIGIFIYWALIATREKPTTQDPVVPSPFVRVMKAEPQTLRMTVITRGVVAPRTESDLVAEVRGRVVAVSPKLVVGGFFEAGDELLRLDDRESRIALDRARATVALRESQARLAAADANRGRQLERRGASSFADREEFESRESVAVASLNEARATLQQAEFDLERTVVRAPFAGRVRERSVDVGQYVTIGTKLGRIFAVDYAEVRLPIQVDDLAHLDVALDDQGIGGVEGAEVRLTGRLGGRELAWPARLVRAEAAIDEQTRMLNVVARVDDPYALGIVPGPGEPPEADADAETVAEEVPIETAPPGRRIPLPVGLFVEAEVQGRTLTDVYVLPVMALRDEDRIFVHDQDGLLRIRDVSVVRRNRDDVVIDGGIEPGDSIVISPLRIYSEGMRLRAVEEATR